jgi:glucose-1-phosphate thymidylyltransferase
LIRNDEELKVTQERIRYFEGLLAQFRVTTRAEEFEAVAGGYRAEIEQMQGEVLDHHIFEAVRNIEPSARGELEISDAHQYLLDHGYTVGYSEITGWWKDTGQPIDLLEANRLVLEHTPGRMEGEVDEDSNLFGNVIVEKGSRIINSNIRGPAIIGEDTHIEDSYIGPFTAIYHHCHVRRSEIEYSIVLENCRILDVVARNLPVSGKPL